ncbi:MarR family winged helix-turn-helix transcriptional regulator [Paenibacillus ginsengarvi]|uniref:MarR family transcriptional regulator n=1 Tax=Paenibacillus ginsengarvi TaxID=400777 RepID=A0A3B0BVG3_9BACL|nr:MarR family transcriptional regulator [Paenibacillus ginsengarvi]RKN75987.1 MarR family transcriptional regulator [Paenibacillus ginsengarvi]
MSQKNNKDQATDQLPKLGIQPYLELMDKTAGKERNGAHSRLGLLMLWFSDHFLDAVDLELAPFGITESKLDLLLLLKLHENRTYIAPSSLADRLGIRRASVTALLDWLEKRNLIIREQSELDRRRIHVQITKEGQELLDRVLPAFWSACSSIMNDLDHDEVALLDKMLVKLNAGIEKKLGVGR